MYRLYDVSSMSSQTRPLAADNSKVTALLRGKLEEVVSLRIF
jgi:hypothetical protein